MMSWERKWKEFQTADRLDESAGDIDTLKVDLSAFLVNDFPIFFVLGVSSERKKESEYKKYGFHTDK